MDLFYFQITFFLKEPNVLAYYATAIAQQLPTSWQTFIHSTMSHPIKTESLVAPQIELQTS